ncbi:RNA-directed DNA polymerase, eukaryota [Tanacetum coccineum]
MRHLSLLDHLNNTHPSIPRTPFNPRCIFCWFGMGYDDWQEVSREKRGYKSKENDVAKISTSIFVTNFPESTSAKDLFNACKVYGHVVDSFIPNKRAKNGKCFAFIRFINVFSVERLVSNLCTVWIEKHRLQANLAKYNRASVNQNVKEVKSKNNYNTHKVGVSSRPSVSSVPTHVKGQANSFANVVNGTTSGTQGSLISSSPAIVIDDSCLVERDLSKQVMGKVKEFASIPKLSSIIKDEGFPDVSLTYLGGTWVLFEFINVETKENFMRHSGINSWFEAIQEACNDFVSEERIVWMDIEGIPLNAWSRETFVKIGKKWGEALDLEDSADTSFGRKRICVMTKHPVCILETFKVIVKGRVFMARAKELYTWNPSFIVHKEKEYASEDESIHVPKYNEFHQHLNEDDFGDKYDSEEEGVPETAFGSNASSRSQVDKDKGISHSDDPFEIYKILNNKNRESVFNVNKKVTFFVFKQQFFVTSWLVYTGYFFFLIIVVVYTVCGTKQRQTRLKQEVTTKAHSSVLYIASTDLVHNIKTRSSSFSSTDLVFVHDPI